MLITEMEVVSLVQSAIRQTATKLKIADVIWKSGQELLGEIAERDRETYNVLQSFLNGYIDWFRFHKRIEEAGKQGHLDREEHEEVARLVGNRNSTRLAIIGRLAGLV
jgi:hypothetical protein